MQDVERVIRERAYHLWQESGCADGHAEAHWLAAQREVLQASLGELGRIAVGTPAGKPKKAKAPRAKKRAA
jgi:Protein of unknown function (DUF2934)